jgi:PAS domain S-box-containing protein
VLLKSGIEQHHEANVTDEQGKEEVKRMAQQLAGTAIDIAHDSRSSNARRISHIWYITIIMIACLILYYLDVILDFVGLPNPDWGVFLITHDLPLLLFSIPLLYAAYVFRLRGIAVVTGVTLVLIFIPHAMFSASYLEPLLRAATFLFFIAVVGVLIAYLQDRKTQITEAYIIVKQHEEKLMIAETAIRTCISAIATADLSGRLTYVNPTFLRIWGYDNPDEVLGRSIASFYKEERETQRVIQALQTEGGTKAAELVGKKKDGTEFIVGLKTSLIVDAEGQPIGITVSLADITARIKAEEKKRKLT